MEPMTTRFMGQHSNQLNYTSQGCLSILNHLNAKLSVVANSSVVQVLMNTVYKQVAAYYLQWSQAEEEKKVHFPVIHVTHDWKHWK